MSGGRLSIKSRVRQNLTAIPRVEGQTLKATMSTTPRTSKTSKPTVCAKCSSTDLVRRITTYPVRMSAPPVAAGKEIHVGRVALYDCQSCGHLMPTAAGQAKVERCVGQALRMLLETLP